MKNKAPIGYSKGIVEEYIKQTNKHANTSAALWPILIYGPVYSLFRSFCCTKLVLGLSYFFSLLLLFFCFNLHEHPLSLHYCILFKTYIEKSDPCELTMDIPIVKHIYDPFLTYQNESNIWWVINPSSEKPINNPMLIKD